MNRDGATKTHRVLIAILATLSGILPCAVTALAQQAPTQASAPFAEQKITFASGITGQLLRFESASPRNFQEVIAKAGMPKVTLDGQLFLPAGQGPHPVVIIAPGSGGVSPPMMKHAEELTKAGIGAYLFDPFTARGISSTVANQAQLSWAASAIDVLMAARMLSEQAAIDRSRVGAMGYSRGGIAVVMAASEQMATSVLGRDLALKAVLAGWPWCGMQFHRAATTRTAIRFLVAASDNWVSPVQCQGQAAALRATNQRISIRLVKDASHGFGYGRPMREIPEASHALYAPILYLDDQGTFRDNDTGELLTDSAVGQFFQPWLGKGVSAGSKPGQMEDFMSDMSSFFRREL